MIHRIIDLANQGAVDGYKENPRDGEVLGDGLGAEFEFQLTPDPTIVPETPSADAQAFAVTGDTSGALWVRCKTQVDQNAADISALNDKIDTEIANVNRATGQKIDTFGALYQKKGAAHLDMSNVVFCTLTSGTYNVVKNAVNVITPSSGANISALTLNMPAGVNGDGVLLVFTQAITTVTYTGTAVRNSTTAPGAKSNRFYFINTTQWE